MLLLNFTLFNTYAQTTTITTESGTGFDGGNSLTGNSFVTFVIENTNTYDIILTGLDAYWNTANNGTVPTLWYSSSSLSGAITGVASPTWTSITTGSAITVAANGYLPTLTGMNFVIPAGTQYRFLLQSSTGIRYSGTATIRPTPNTLSSNGVNLKVDNAQINSADVGVTGIFPNSSNSPRAFTGRIHFQPALPCTAPPTGGQATSSVNTICPNVPFQLSLTGASGGQGMTYQWQSSANGTSGWTNVTGLNNATVTTAQTTTTWYRAQLTCSGQTANSAPVQVSTNASPVSGTFTINKNIPASATNFQSFAAAIASIECGGAGGPIVFNVAPNSGPYNEQVIVPVIPGTSATNTVTFNGNGNTISAIPASGTQGAITLDGAKFIKFDNLVITLEPTVTAGWGVQFLNGADNNTISNNTINLPINSTNVNLVGIGTGATPSTYGNHTNNSRIQNNIINGGYYGIRMNGTSATANSAGNQITGNQVKDFYFYGIYLYYSGTMLIEGNEITRTNRSDGATIYGIFNGYSMSNIINRNRIHDINRSTVYGIYNGYSDSPIGSEGIIKNNLIYDLISSGTTYGIYNISSDGSYFFHNTVDLRNTNTTGGAHGFYQTTTSANMKFQNNIISIDGGTSGSKYAMYYGVTTSTINSNNNVIHTTNGANAGYYSGVKATLADWQTASSQDANSVATDPMFTNLATGNLQPTNSNINGIGAVLTPPVTDDFTGATRSTAAPDPGAYEFTPASNDAGVIAIITPTSPVQPGVSQPIQVTIKNYGASILTNVTITATITGTATQTITYNWTGSLTNLATANVTIGNYTFPTGNYTLNVCTSNPNGATDGNPTNDCFAMPVVSCTALAGPYTINKNNPTAGTNFASLSDAVTRLNSCGVSGAVTFTVAPNSGPYYEQMVLGPISGVSATNTVTFEGSGNTISASPGTTSPQGVVTLDGATFVKVNNFTITLDSTATAGWGVQFLNEADNNTISNNIINLPLTSISANFWGIGSGSSATFYGNNANNSKIQNNIINGGYYGIRLGGTSSTATSTGNEITGNQILDAYYAAIYLYYSGNVLIEGNTINRLGRSAGTIFYSIYPSYSPNLTISKNKIYGVGGSSFYGIYTYECDATAGSENIISNNLIYNLTNTGITYPLYNSGTANTSYYYNTVELNNTNNNGVVRGFFQTTAATNVKFQNNIISITGGAGTNTGLYFGTAASAITSNNNVIHVPVGDVGYYGSAFTTLANWQTANSGAYDQNSVAADPNFLSPSTGNYTPSSALVNNIGTPITGVTDDILGNSRSATTPDPGAYEFTLNPNDVGIIAISGPVSGCGLTANETISVTIKNFGTTSQTSVPVSYTVNTGNAVNQTWTGTLAPNGTAVLTFTQTVDMSVAGPYTIIASTQLTGDGDASNDADTLIVTNSLMPAGPVSIDFEIPTSGVNAMRVVTNANSNITESTAAATGTGSTKGMIMDGVNSSAWTIPSAAASPWTINPDNFSAVYLCFTPQAGKVDDSLFLEFDLKQLYKTTHFNTNFRVTVNGQQIGTSYNPPFGGYGTGVAPWTHVKLDISSYLNNQTIEIGLESSVNEAYQNGNGTANLVDNIMVQRVAGPTVGTGVKENLLQSNVVVFPNPSNGNFNLKVPATTRSYSVEVTDLTGKVVKQQLVKNNSGAEQLNLNGTAKGIYILKIASEGNVATRKLIVE